MSRDEQHNLGAAASAGERRNGQAGDVHDDVLLDQLTERLRDLPVPDGPDEQTLAATLSALRNAAATVEPPPALRIVPRINSPKRIMTMKALIKLAVAACVALAVGLAFLTNPGGRALAFADVIEHVKQARSVRYKSFIRVEMPGGKVHTSNATTLIAGNVMRQEMPGIIHVMDLEKGETLMLQTEEKQATRMTTRNRPQPREGQVTSMNLLEHFRSLKSDQSKDLGLKKVDGRPLRGFVIEQQPGASMTVWADPKTQEPVRIEAKFNIPGVPPSTTVMTDFEWDVPADPALMTLEVPKGYTVSNLELNASPPAEADLIEGLRMLAELNGGEFTRNFGRDGINEAVKKAQPTMPKTAEEVQAFRTERTPKVVKVARSLSFMTPANGDEWHYAGEGAKLGEAGRAVMWYRPKGAETYRVIDADLTVRDVPADALPDVEAKKITPGTVPVLTATTAPSERPKR